MTYPGPRRPLRSIRSDSGTWDQLVEAIITAQPVRDSQVFDDIELHESPIAEEAAEELASTASLDEHVTSAAISRDDHVVDHRQPSHQARPSLAASTIVNDSTIQTGPRSLRPESGVDSMLTTARASIAEETPDFRISIKLSDDFDATLKDPLKAEMADEKAKQDLNDKETRVSLSGSHSGSSTVNEPHEDAHPAKNAGEAGRPEADCENEPTDAVTKAAFSWFPTRAKRFIVLSAASASIFAPLSMQIYLPSLTTLVTDFGVSRTKINLTVSVYMIFMAISPMIMGGISDIVGRRPTMLVCFAIYMVSCIMIALCHTYTELLGFRILQSIGASPLIAIASAVVADIVTSAERGSYAALVAVPVIFAPTLGPVIGGLLTQYLGWRSIFWFLLVAGSLGFLLIGTLFPETCRIIVGDASARPPKRYRSAVQVFRDARPGFTQSAADEKARLRGRGGVRALLWASLTSAVRVLFTKERFFLLFYVGLVFSGFQAIATELPTQFKAIYGYSSVMIGVMYLPLAGGAMISTAVFGRQMNKNFRKYAARAGVSIEAGQEVDMNQVDVERARLEITLPSLLISAAGLVCWGWVLEAKTSVAAPCVLLFFMGVGLNGVMATTNALLMDISQSQAGAVMAASNLTRCALGAVASAVVQMMIDKLGLGWSYVVFGLLFLLLSPMLAIHYFRGHRWRREAHAKEVKRLAEKARGGDIEQASEIRADGQTQQKAAGDVEAPRTPELGLSSSRSDKERVKATTLNSLVNSPAIPLVEITHKQERVENIIGSAI